MYKFACVCKNFRATFCLCLCDVIATDVENVWLVHLKILPGFHPPLIRSFNMISCRAIWQCITKNELHGFIILYKTINVIIKYVLEHMLCYIGKIIIWAKSKMLTFFEQSVTISNTTWTLVFVYILFSTYWFFYLSIQCVILCFITNFVAIC